MGLTPPRATFQWSETPTGPSCEHRHPIETPTGPCCEHRHPITHRSDGTLIKYNIVVYSVIFSPVLSDLWSKTLTSQTFPYESESGCVNYTHKHTHACTHTHTHTNHIPTRNAIYQARSYLYAKYAAIYIYIYIYSLFPFLLQRIFWTE